MAPDDSRHHCFIHTRDLIAHASFDSPADEYQFVFHGYTHTVSLILDDIMPIFILSGVIIAGMVFVFVKDSS